VSKSGSEQHRLPNPWQGRIDAAAATTRRCLRPRSSSTTTRARVS